MPTPDRRAAGLFIAVVLTMLSTAAPAGAAGPTADEARAFIDRVEAELYALEMKAARASWVMSTHITHDTETLAADADKNLNAARARAAKEAARFRDLELPVDVRRKLERLRTAMAVAAPMDAGRQLELSQTMAAMESAYGKGEYCPKEGECLDLNALSRILAESRDPERLLEVWRGWHAISPPLRPLYRRFVELGNEGAGELGYADLGALWRSGYDMSPESFAA
ncbi:MAG TPA: M2 family metallopeptidase, partial [Candidatus Polarisedimenticolia bacterium]|nr:M2 family metallopeptidase [Candidatus Polarisedimenticolia bacterium]